MAKQIKLFLKETLKWKDYSALTTTISKFTSKCNTSVNCRGPWSYNTKHE